ncbi:MAG TPA: cytochrome P450 [Aestuariivirgaceae bacterium]
MSQAKPTPSQPGSSPVELHALLEEERQQSGIVFDPRSPELRANPYPRLHELRATDPVHWSPLLAAWLLSRYDDVQKLFRQPGLSKDFRNAPPSPLGGRDATSPAGTPTMLRLDPPDHTRLRSLVSKAFTPRAVEALQPRIQTIADDLLDAVPTDVPFDLMQAFANHLPVIVIAELLGVPAADREQFKTWSTDLILGAGAFRSPDARARREAARAQLLAYFERVVQERRREPRADLISALIKAEEQGDRLSEAELLDTCILLLVAGNETTTNLIGNAMLALLQHPDQLQLLQRDSARIGQAVEELLRYDSPVQLLRRLLTTEIEIGGKCIAPGTVAIVLVGAANRDPDVFPNPDRLDITRRGASHISFGHGIHYCLGAPLARAEASIAITTLLRRFPRLQLATEPPVWRPALALRGLEALPVIPGISVH